MGRQIPLDLVPEPTPSFSNFILAPGNARAHARLTQDRWEAPITLLVGPPGSGKSHLAMAWATGGGRVIENADTVSESELFAAINTALEGVQTQLLLTSRLSPADWDIHMPDLASRIGATTTVYIEDPADDLLIPVLRQFFMRQGRNVDDKTLAFIINRHDRSIDALRRLVRALETRARSEKADITLRYVSRHLSPDQG